MPNDPCAPPVPSPGTRLIVTIADVAFGGHGVARVDGWVLFVPFVLPGEEVEVELTQTRRGYGQARLVRVLRPSPSRRTPPCRYFGDCGGCQYQHIDYALQLELKRKQVADLLERIGGFSRPPVGAPVPSPQPYHYRNRIMIRSQWNKIRQRLHLGFIRQDNRLVVDIEECVIADPALNRQLRELRAHPPPRGGLKVVLRVPPPGWDVPPDSFFQNNLVLLPCLVETVKACLRRSGSTRLIDAYCGVGFFGIELADAVERFVGLEVDARAVQAARRNAANRRVANGEFHAGSVEDRLGEWLARLGADRTTVILDPPRRGCQARTLQTLRELSARQLIYISCHPATLARDLQALCESGVYRLVQVQPLDMFPQTQHLECVADLSAGVASRPGQTSLANGQPLVSTEGRLDLCKTTTTPPLCAPSCPG